MKIKIGCMLAVLLLAGCAKEQQPPPQTKVIMNRPSMEYLNAGTPPETGYNSYIRSASNNYGIDETLIKAIIQVESGGNPRAVSKSNAVGLMQLKASTAGRDAYRQKGRYGEPTTEELKDPAVNIDLGTAYLSILRDQLADISNPQTMRYAVIVAYVNGAGAMLRTFSPNRKVAIDKINALTPEQFYQHIQRKHPAPQAPRYLWKVNNAYLAMLQ
ncbi:transglycosylase SLT domain-containing protein [Enterobacillus tribolii]|uniref:peptidoglycan lytic exotransglycosylase n=1 Tax=Enterobacillus tribolii TaxID=1487935 RepID=A0A370R3I5_9GAMM|nr:transglycosylase SLT domain-containing protein [Enterobacillus tribolii]RDK97006.1 membrane-bound lytic murein transglycosylase E [Enterobacillus tribolii]